MLKLKHYMNINLNKENEAVSLQNICRHVMLYDLSKQAKIWYCMHCVSINCF